MKNDNVQNELRSTRLGGRTWLSIVLFGMVGWLAWVVKNVYFGTFAQNLFSDTAKFGKLYFLATTLMVTLSAIVEAAATVIAGAVSDRMGKRKPFIAVGYILWGVTIMLFAAIPVGFETGKAKSVVALLILFTCIATVMGSASNDAAFSAWTADITDVTNRGRVYTILSILNVLATVVTVFIAMLTFDKKNYKLFFIILGVIPIITGLLAFFLLKDAPQLEKAPEHESKNLFYGFRASVMRENRMLYVCLLASCLLSIAQSTFMPYLLNFIVVRLGIEDYTAPFVAIVFCAAFLTAAFGLLYDRFGRKRFYIPLSLVLAVGTALIYTMKFMPSSAYRPMLYAVGIPLFGASMALGSALVATFQDYIPKGMVGQFQGVRMGYVVLVPMIVGPVISLAVGVNSPDTMDAAVSAPPFEFFLLASVVVLIALIPMAVLRKDADRLRARLIAEKTGEEAAEKEAQKEAE